MATNSLNQKLLSANTMYITEAQWKEIYQHVDYKYYIP